MSYFLDFFLVEIPNFIQIITSITIVGLFLPGKYIITVFTVSFLFLLYLWVKIFHVPHGNFHTYGYKFFADNIKLYLVIFIILSTLILSLTDYLLVKMVVVIEVENKISQMEQKKFIKQLTPEEIKEIMNK